MDEQEFTARLDRLEANQELLAEAVQQLLTRVAALEARVGHLESSP